MQTAQNSALLKHLLLGGSAAPSEEEANGILLEAAAVIAECLPFATADGEQQLRAALSRSAAPELSWSELSTPIPPSAGKETPLELLA